MRQMVPRLATAEDDALAEAMLGGRDGAPATGRIGSSHRDARSSLLLRMLRRCGHCPRPLQSGERTSVRGRLQRQAQRQPN